MTASDLLDEIIAALMRGHGGTRRRWRSVLGQVRVRDPATHPHCNWTIEPTGTAAEVATVERLLDDVRLRRRIVTPG